MDGTLDKCMQNSNMDVPLCWWTGLCSCHGRHLTSPEVAQGHEQIGGALFSLDISTGEAELLLDNWNGLRFNSPNDLVVRTAAPPSPQHPHAPVRSAHEPRWAVQNAAHAGSMTALPDCNVVTA